MNLYWDYISNNYKSIKKDIVDINNAHKSINSSTSEDVLHDAMIYCYYMNLTDGNEIRQAIINQYKQLRFRNLMDNKTCYIEDNAELVKDVTE